MDRVEKHIKQWRHNRRFAKTIDANFRDWQITVVFYAALHLIDAALVKLGVQVSDHVGRNEHVKMNASLAAVRREYLDLYRISRVTRYDADPDLWLPSQYLTVNDLVDALLKPLENGLSQLLGKTVSFDPLHLQE